MGISKVTWEIAKFHCQSPIHAYTLNDIDNCCYLKKHVCNYVHYIMYSYKNTIQYTCKYKNPNNDYH